MSNATYFVQECPTCGRRLQVRVEYLGRSMVCQHCRGPFQARHPEHNPRPSVDAQDSQLDRVDQLLSSVWDSRRDDGID